MCKRNSVDSVPRWPILLLKCFSSSIFSFHYSVVDRCLCWPIGSLECGWSCTNSSNEKQRVQSTIDQSHVNRSKRDGHMPRQLCHMPPLISINLTVFQTKIIHFFAVDGYTEQFLNWNPILKLHCLYKLLYDYIIHRCSLGNSSAVIEWQYLIRPI